MYCITLKQKNNLSMKMKCIMYYDGVNGLMSRSRDCKKCDVYLHCNTQPIIEFSVDMKFACLQLHYESLSG